MILNLFGYPEAKIKEILKEVHGERKPHELIMYDASDPEDKMVANYFKWNKQAILTAINVYHTNEAKEPKMTREEALNKLKKACIRAMGSYNSSTDEMFIFRLETLGLIKFDEEAKSLSIDEAINIARVKTMGTKENQYEFIKTLNELGYKIVKKD